MILDLATIINIRQLFREVAVDNENFTINEE
jgi:hypothetical protein